MSLRPFILMLLCLLAAPVSAQPPTPANPSSGSSTPATRPDSGGMTPLSLRFNGREQQATLENPANPLVLMSTTRGDILLELFPDNAPLTVTNFLELAEGTKPFTDPYSGQRTMRPFYDGLVFHRVIEGFIVQGGSPTGTADGTPGYQFRDEINATSLGLDRMLVIDDESQPNPVLGIQERADFERRVLLPLYTSMGITGSAALEARLGEAEQRLRALTVKESYELLGYRYLDTVRSRPPLRGTIAMANAGPDSNGSQFFILLGDADWLLGKHTVFGRVRLGMDVLDAIGKTRVNDEGRPRQDITILSVRRFQPQQQPQATQGSSAQ